MIFRQLFDTATSTFTYLLADEESAEAVLIDCVYEQHVRDAALIRELGLRLKYTVETHVHADHVTGGWLMKEAMGSAIAASKKSGANGVDLPLSQGDTIRIGSVELSVRETPGHTDGCLTFVCKKMKAAFTGDALLIRGAGRTDFQQGDAATLFRSVHEHIFSLPDETALYPGHDYSGRTVTTVAEEKNHNPRLGSQVREQDFVGYMKNLGLPHPKKLEIAVPANLESGKPQGELGEASTDWGPVIRTFAGVLQIDPEWVHAHLGQVTLIDVRESAEKEASPLGAIPGSQLIPLGELRQRTSEVPGDNPVITVCPAGARSAMAAGILEKAGVKKVANLRGGLLEWKALGLPVEK